MKKALAILVIVLLFLGILAAILFKVFTPATKKSVPVSTNTNVVSLPVVTNDLQKIDISTPASIAYVCYSWYLHYASIAQISKQVVSTNPTIARCFSTGFITTWITNLDNPGYVDPVLVAVDLSDSWLTTQVDVSQSSDTSTSSLVEVILGKGDTRMKALAVHLIKVNGDWKIDSVESQDNASINP